MKVLVGRENIVKFSRNFVVRSRGFISPLTLTSLTAGNRSDFAISQTISENISQREKKAYCEAQGKGRAKGRPRKVTQRCFIDGGWWISFPL